MKGVVSPPRPVPPHIGRPPYAESSVVPPWSDAPQVQDAAGVAKMRAAGRLAADVLRRAGQLVAPGVRTDDIDEAVHGWVVAAGAYPSPLNYGAFPKSVCTSVNEVLCHGIPDSTVLQTGDIINIDVTVFLDGFHGDTSATFCVGVVDAEAAQLVDAARRALDAGIAVCRPGAPYRSVGSAIQRVADQYGYGIADGFCGHGVGSAFHSGPMVIHNANTSPGVFVLGQTFTIEPMLTLTKAGAKERVWADNWTAVSRDGSWSAQFEHTLLIVPNGVEILTRMDDDAPAGASGDAAAAAERRAPPPPPPPPPPKAGSKRPKASKRDWMSR